MISSNSYYRSFTFIYMISLFMSIIIIMFFVYKYIHILGNCEITFEGHTNSVYSVIQLKDGRICSGDHDGKIKLWTLNGKHIIIYIL